MLVPKVVSKVTLSELTIFEGVNFSKKYANTAQVSSTGYNLLYLMTLGLRFKCSKNYQKVI